MLWVVWVFLCTDLPQVELIPGAPEFFHVCAGHRDKVLAFPRQDVALGFIHFTVDFLSTYCSWLRGRGVRGTSRYFHGEKLSINLKSSSTWTSGLGMESDGTQRTTSWSWWGPGHRPQAPPTHHLQDDATFPPLPDYCQDLQQQREMRDLLTSWEWEVMWKQLRVPFTSPSSAEEFQSEGTEWAAGDCSLNWASRGLQGLLLNRRQVPRESVTAAQVHATLLLCHTAR